MELAAFIALCGLFIFAFGYVLGRSSMAAPHVHRHYHFPPESDSGEPERDEWWKRNGHTDQFETD